VSHDEYSGSDESNCGLGDSGFHQLQCVSVMAEARALVATVHPSDHGRVKAMTNRTMDVRWHDITDPANLDLYLYLGPGTFDTETVLTVICGEVSGELDRVVSCDEDGGLVMVYEARIDGLADGQASRRSKATAPTSSCVWRVSWASWRVRWPSWSAAIRSWPQPKTDHQPISMGQAAIRS
jgi:hypothetical protein